MLILEGFSLTTNIITALLISGKDEAERFF